MSGLFSQVFTYYHVSVVQYFFFAAANRDNIENGHHLIYKKQELLPKTKNHAENSENTVNKAQKNYETLRKTRTTKKKLRTTPHISHDLCFLDRW